MKAPMKAKPAPRRNLFAELSEGMTALAQARQGKRTLRTHAVEFKPAPEITARELVRVRQHLRLSRALFATDRPRETCSAIRLTGVGKYANIRSKIRRRE